MKFRWNMWPRHNTDMSCIFLMCNYWYMSYIYFFKLLLPAIHATNKQKSTLQQLVSLVAVFMACNIICNWLASILVDTSVQTIKRRARLSWRFCMHCHVWGPPRSWHCIKCNICILKRNHHCNFSGYCVGHNNQRYFIFFLLYSCLAATLICSYGCLFAWRMLHGDPKMLADCHQSLYRLCNWHWLALLISCLALIFILRKLIFFVALLLQGATVFERRSITYDYGWMLNLEMALGRRYYIAWLSPLIRSELPHDGTLWLRINTNGK